MENIKTFGFINYFGEQRFGTDLTTPLIGQNLLTRNFKKAVFTMLAPQFDCQDNKDTTNDRVEKAKSVFSATSDPDKTLLLMPDYKTRECMVLKALKRYSFTEEGSVKAFLNLSYATRLFYLHSYCSFVWNRALSARVKKFGFDVLPGDLISDNGEIRTLSEEEVSNFSFRDILFPLPGTLVMYPENETKSIYNEILQEDGIQASDFHVRKLSINHIPGSYRGVLSFPTELKYNLKTGDDGEVDLHMDFILPSSSYATVLMRELLHSETVLKLL